MEQFIRTALLIGTENIEKLQKARVAVFGIGGVGGFAVEGLVRAGVGSIDLIDNDRVSLSNCNRQIIATMNTIGRQKVDVMRERILSINPEAEVTVHSCFFLPENKNQFDFSEYDYVVDAIDTVTGKLCIIEECKKAGTPVISCMGTGNKLDPGRLEVTDISKTSVCPLAKVMRRELKKRHIDHVKVLYSREPALSPREELLSKEERESRRPVPGSVSFVPSVAGLMMAGEVIKDLCGIERLMKDRTGNE